jgi:hypothetical protein
MSSAGAIGMPRTIISLTQEDKEWLAQRARAEHVPVTKLVRRAIRVYRQGSGGSVVRETHRTHRRELNTRLSRRPS